MLSEKTAALTAPRSVGVKENGILSILKKLMEICYY